MSYHIRANYESTYTDYTCDDYSLLMDDVVLFRKVSKGVFKEAGTISFRNKNFVGIEIEKIEGLQ